MNVDLKMGAAKLVREVMKAHGRPSNMIYNNIYKTGTRTVKCYLPRTRQELENLIRDLEHVLSHMPVKYVIKITKSSWAYAPSGLIVKFPADIQYWKLIDAHYKK